MDGGRADRLRRRGSSCWNSADTKKSRSSWSKSRSGTSWDRPGTFPMLYSTPSCTANTEWGWQKNKSCSQGRKQPQNPLHLLQKQAHSPTESKGSCRCQPTSTPCSSPRKPRKSQRCHRDSSLRSSWDRSEGWFPGTGDRQEQRRIEDRRSLQRKRSADIADKLKSQSRKNSPKDTRLSMNHWGGRSQTGKPSKPPKKKRSRKGSGDPRIGSRTGPETVPPGCRETSRSDKSRFGSSYCRVPDTARTSRWSVRIHWCTLRRRYLLSTLRSLRHCTDSTDRFGPEGLLCTVRSALRKGRRDSWGPGRWGRHSRRCWACSFRSIAGRSREGRGGRRDSERRDRIRRILGQEPGRKGRTQRRKLL